MNLQPSPRYKLTIVGYPDEPAVPNVCKLIYGTSDRNLIATLSQVPFALGRSFEASEAERIHRELVRLDVHHRLEGQDPATKPMIHGESETSVASNVIALNPGKAVLPLSAARAANSLSGIFKFNSIFKKRDLLIGLALLIVIGASARFLMRAKVTPESTALTPEEISSARTESSSEIVLSDYQALVESIHSKVEVKHTKDLVWQSAAARTVLEGRDSIRTFEHAEAVLKYREGSRLLVRENTLLVIGESLEARQLQLEDGTIQTHLKRTEKPQTLSIKTSAGTLQLTTPTSDAMAETQINTAVKNGTLEVKVTAGTVTLVPVNKNQKTLEIGASQKVTATPEFVGLVEAYMPEVSLLSPDTDTHWTINPDSKSASAFTFAWLDVREPETMQHPYDFEIAYDQDFKTILLTQKSAVPNVLLSYLDPGTLYWRARIEINGLKYLSETRRLYVDKKSHD